MMHSEGLENIKSSQQMIEIGKDSSSSAFTLEIPALVKNIVTNVGEDVVLSKSQTKCEGSI